MSNDGIYMDYNATTPVDPGVAEAMAPYLADVFGNPASKNHAFGRRAAQAVHNAREQTARLIGASAGDLVLTSGATESNNLAIKGVAEAYRRRGDRVVTSLAEHKAVIDPCRWLETQGFEVVWLRPDRFGRIAPEQVAEAIDERTVLVSIMAANNEVGTLNPVAEIGRVCRERGVFFHTDATQAVGRVPVDVEAWSADLLSFSAHKFYGPKGVGGLYVRRRGPRVRPACQVHGGGHEHGLRSGTLNVPGVVGMGATAGVALEGMEQEARRVSALRDRLAGGILDALEDVQRNGHPTECLPNTLNLSFARVEGEAVMLRMEGVAASTGSACTSETQESSHVLRAMGVSDDRSHGSLRLSLGRWTTREEVDTVIERCFRAVTDLRKMSVL